MILKSHPNSWFGSIPVVIDHEILSTVIRTVPLLWHVQKFQFLAKVEATSTDKA
jgi:hypothetical protein